MKRIAVLLSGSGYLDGSEIRESVAVLWALSRAGAKVQCYAPDAAQLDVVNSMTGNCVSGESRNMLVESARIARGQALPLSSLAVNSSDFDGVIIPGGYGVAKNLCSFASLGAAGTVHADIEKVLLAMHRERKRIGAVCIAPALVALVFRGQGLELTVGEKSEASVEIEKLGHRHVVCAADSCHFDEQNQIASTPAYMCEQAPLHHIFEGIRKLVDRVVQ
ncbi:MAG: isoprenoid biosynthesis protein ElbB [Bdellovibrionales bacterium GWB1_55_8]|nr:MAG: isoprenoid biosynthesis protein ElbB [Bdellovibrionales bacterium GWB1_55_8]